jgi:outer membrane protein OmpU
MKKVLLASTALVLSAGIAAADVSVGGSGRMGIISNVDDTTTTNIDESDLGFTSRIRISFSASGETDAGLQFGGSIRADNAVGGNAGTAGSVFISGTFGKISMGDVSGAPEAAVGDLSGVGLTGLGDYNEFVYLSNSDRPAARWDYTVADLGLHVSADNPRDDNATTADPALGIAVTYGMGDISAGLGYETTGDVDHIIGGVAAGFGDATVKVIYGSADDSTAADLDFDQYGMSLDFVSGATTFTAYFRTVEGNGALAGSGSVYGLGVSYDLGGGASIVAGYVDGDDVDPTSAAFGSALTNATYDAGISFSF